MQFTDWAVQARTVYGPQLCFGPYTILALTAQSINCHIAIKINIILSYICVVIYWERMHGLRIKTNLRKSFLYTKLKMAGVCCWMKGIYKPAKHGKNSRELITHITKKRKKPYRINK